jgi:hypothetical protein
MLWPATLEAPGQLVGPLVHPGVRGSGIGAAMLRLAASVAAARPGIAFTTDPIPASRPSGWTLFERAGWHPSGSAYLFTADLPVVDGEPDAAGVAVRPAKSGEYLNRAVADLILQAYPQYGHAAARDTFARWTSDERYRPDGLLLTGDESGLSGATLVYPQTDEYADGPAEAFIADLVVHPRLDATTASAVGGALAAAAARASASFGAAVARTVVRCPSACAALVKTGFRRVDEVRYYTLPTVLPRSATAFLSLSSAR